MTKKNQAVVPGAEAERPEPRPSVVTAIVVAKERYRQFCRLILYAPEISRKAYPGQFINVYLDPTFGEPSWERMSIPPALMLPRPFSIADVQTVRKPSGSHFSDQWDDAGLTLFFDLRSMGTRILAQLTPQAPLRIAGPLGKGFWLPDGGAQPVLVAGGIGLAPFPFLVKRLLSVGLKPVVLVGARQSGDLPMDPVRATEPITAEGQPLSVWSLDEWAGKGVLVAVALEKKEEGFFHGTVIDLLVSFLDSRKEPVRFALYGCGPMPMLKALSKIAQEREIPLQVATEERMACGLGLCFGCPIPSLNGSYRLCCVDGPVFDASQVDWSRAGALHPSLVSAGGREDQ
ncbi:MAG: hypothetical protein NZ959_09530 [Armatimonadetes bacterium]|nr:hypothetical protein [Armatimonadota bacterium]MDW8122726.1 hypothetical protein [Armatimonadota bacterium]